jgi:hypothetical protein
MNSSRRLLTAVALLGLAVTASSARAQYRGRIPMTVNQQSALNWYNSFSPVYNVYGGMTLEQYAYNVALLGRAY